MSQAEPKQSHVPPPWKESLDLPAHRELITCPVACMLVQPYTKCMAQATVTLGLGYRGVGDVMLPQLSTNSFIH